ncbi:hypothetical protein LY78DRAFT_603288 [Colletotrichum sublineola]|nr:hypothetical protein LY78DRAFT_603288 [Colletotrichum sublineola]
MARKDIAQIAKDLRQKDSTGDRRAAIVLLAKELRHKDRFHPAWDAVGGATGLARLMAEFSVRDVRLICRRLGNTAYAQNVCHGRRESLGELVRLLYDDPQEDRPLTTFYQEIVPACSLEMVQEWEQERKVEWNESQLCKLRRCHRDRYEQEFLQELFSPETSNLNFEAHKSLFSNNLQFCDMVLSMLITNEEYAQIPSDFTTKFVMPLLRRLLKGRYDNETRDAFLDRAIQCYQRREGILANDIHIQRGGVLQYTIQLWVGVKGDRKEEMKARVAKLLALVPTKKRLLSLQDIYTGISIPRKLAPEAKYDLLRLFFRHIKGYEMSLEDNSATGLMKWRDLAMNNNLWPTKLFFSIGIENGRNLFERLVKANPNGDFLKPHDGVGEKSVAEQTRAPGIDTSGDAEVVSCLLHRISVSESRHQTWIDRARSIVEERKKKSQQSREAKDRAFWAKSALNLCFAAGDLDMVAATVLWARRFNKDFMTANELYGNKTWATQEAEELLCAIPKSESLAVTVATSASITRDIKLANKIILDLFETMAMVVKEPGFSYSQWTGVFDLPKAVADLRCSRATSFDEAMESLNSNKFAIDSAEILWKPTMDVLLEVEEIKSKAGIGYSYNGEALGHYVLGRVPKPRVSMMADLAKFLLERMKQRLGEERMRAQMWSVVEIVMRIAQSDQPALACPFIRDLIMDGGDTSLWHRKLINVGFLSSLPAIAAREFLLTVADAIRDKMKEQNLRPFNQDGDKPQPSVIKVTTIKMMAKILQNNFFIDAISSCNILAGLLAEARHIDAKIAIANSLISTLKIPNCPAELRTRVLDALAAYVVPTAAQLSERMPLSEADWAAAADDEGTLPDVGEEAPLLSLMLDQAKNKKLSPEDKSRISQFIVSALEESAVHNNRWMKLFLTKNGFALEANERLPMCPVSPSALASFFKDWLSYIPVPLFQVHCSVILTKVDPTPAILRITEAVKSNRDLVGSNAGKHWLAQFDGSESGKLRLHVSQASDLLISIKEKAMSNLNAVTLRMVQELLLSVAEKFVRKGDNSSLYSLVAHLCHKRFENLHHWDCWRSNCTPLLKDIIAMIENIREDRNNQALSVGPAQRTAQLQVFPNTFKIKIMALPIPYTNVTFGISASTEQVDALIAELSGLIDELASRRKPYHGDFALLKEELKKAHRKTDSVYFAWKLGSLYDVVHLQEPALADYLRLELVGEFLLYADDPSDKDHLQKARNMLYSWKESKAEELRLITFSIEDQLRGRGKRNPLNFD